ncbi:MAG: hypothetical protein MZU91_10460 [Desulfosudis oleivorans]|nr:hypothetical protein [Desulfosudis oleivorans]
MKNAYVSCASWPGCSVMPWLSAWGDAGKIYRENSPAVVVVASIDREGKPVGEGSGFPCPRGWRHCDQLSRGQHGLGHQDQDWLQG